MMNMKKLMLLAAVAALLVSVGLVSSARGARSAGQAPADTLVINTTDLCKDVIGYDGPTPLVIQGGQRGRRFRGGASEHRVAQLFRPRHQGRPAESRRGQKGGRGRQNETRRRFPVPPTVPEAVIENLRAGLQKAARK
jgi:hypothetical protein